MVGLTAPLSRCRTTPNQPVTVRLGSSLLVELAFCRLEESPVVAQRGLRRSRGSVRDLLCCRATHRLDGRGERLELPPVPNASAQLGNGNQQENRYDPNDDVAHHRGSLGSCISIGDMVLGSRGGS